MGLKSRERGGFWHEVNTPCGIVIRRGFWFDYGVKGVDFRGQGLDLVARVKGGTYIKSPGNV